MREQLIKYVELLFAGSPDAADIRQEILQNTLDRYDDLIAQGKTPEAAYSLAISGIGDVSEILNANKAPDMPQNPSAPEDKSVPGCKAKRAAAIALYILCPIPLFILNEFGLETLGLCLLLILVAAATALLITCGKEEKQEASSENKEQALSPDAQLRRSIVGIIRTSALVVFFVLSFATGAWYITWLVFPIAAAIRGIVLACMDLKEVK